MRPSGGGDQPPLQRIPVDAHHLDHLRAERTGDIVELPQPRDLVRGRNRRGRSLHPVRVGALEGSQIDDIAALTVAQRGAGGFGGLEQRVAVQPVGVRVAVRRAVGDPDAGAAIEAGGEFLDLAVVQPDRGVRGLLDEDLGERPTAPTSGLEHLVHERAIEHDPRCY